MPSATNALGVLCNGLYQLTKTPEGRRAVAEGDDKAPQMAWTAVRRQVEDRCAAHWVCRCCPF